MTCYWRRWTLTLKGFFLSYNVFNRVTVCQRPGQRLKGARWHHELVRLHPCCVPSREKTRPRCWWRQHSFLHYFHLSGRPRKEFKRWVAERERERKPLSVWDCQLLNIEQQPRRVRVETTIPVGELMQSHFIVTKQIKRAVRERVWIRPEKGTLPWVRRKRKENWRKWNSRDCVYAPLVQYCICSWQALATHSTATVITLEKSGPISWIARSNLWSLCTVDVRPHSPPPHWHVSGLGR